MSTRAVIAYLRSPELEPVARRLAKTSYDNAPSYLAEDLREATVGEHLRNWVGDRLHDHTINADPRTRLVISELITGALLTINTRELARAFLPE